LHFVMTIDGRESMARRLTALKRFCPTETVLFLLFWLGALVLGRDRLFGDPGSLWHVVVGQRILASHELLRTDPFSFTHAGEPWVPQSWLCECGLALLHRLDGLNTILWATAGLLAGLFTWVAHRLLRAGLHPLLAVLLTLLAMLASAYHFHPRPHLLSILFLGWSFALLCDVEAGRVPLKRMIWLLPLFVLWTNIHGGMLGGLGTLAVTFLGWVIAHRVGLDGPDLSPWQLFGLALLVVGCGLTAFLNPYGIALPRTWFALLGSPLLPRLIDEHAPLLQAGWAGGAVLLFGWLYLIALLGVVPRQWRVTWLVPLIWLALSFTRIRHGPLFAITAVLALAEMFPQIRWVAWLARQGSVVCRLRPTAAVGDGGILTRSVSEAHCSPGEPPRSRFGLVCGRLVHGDLRLAPAVLPGLAVSAALVLQVTGISLPGWGRQWVRLDPRSCPMELVTELHQLESLDPEGTPIFNEMLFGGFLIYYTPALRVFIDDRCELYGDDGLMAYALALRDNPSQVERWADQYGFSLALTRAGSRFDTYLRQSGGWSILGETETATLFRRDMPRRG
jgi:hypothetical protein